MYYAVARLEFLVPHSQSLKEKRSVLNRLKARLENRFHISVAEVEFQDLWQRGALGVALVAHDGASARNALEAIRREAEGEPRVEILDYHMHTGRLDDEERYRLDEDGSAPTHRVPEPGGDA